MKITRYLIVNANGDTRVVTRAPSLSWNEVAFRVNVTIPETWATIRGSVDITMPEPPEALLDVELVDADEGATP